MDDIEYMYMYMYMSPGLREHSHPLHKKPIRDRGGVGGGGWGKENRHCTTCMFKTCMYMYKVDWILVRPGSPCFQTLLFFSIFNFFSSVFRGMYAQFDGNKAEINTINYHYLIFVTEKSLNYYQLLQCTYWQCTQG